MKITMVYKKWFALLIFSCTLTSLFSFSHSVQEIDSLTEIVHLAAHADNQWLFIFDLDNTLIRAYEEQATDEWFFNNVKQLRSLGRSFTEACEETLPPYTAAQNNSSVRVLNSLIFEIIDTLFNRGSHCIALTSRGREDLIEITIRQLNEAGIVFKQNEPIWQKSFPLISARTRYCNGIIFCDGKDKGQMLDLFLKEVGYHPTTIVFVDDSLRNISAVEQFTTNNGLEFFGFHFTRKNS